MGNKNQSPPNYVSEIAELFDKYVPSIMKDTQVNNCCWQDVLIFVLSLISLFVLIIVTLVCLIQDCIKGGVSCYSILAVVSITLLLFWGVICPMKRGFHGIYSSDAAKMAEAQYRFATTYIVEMMRVYKEVNGEKSGREEKCVKGNCGNVNIEVSTK